MEKISSFVFAGVYIEIFKSIENGKIIYSIYDKGYFIHSSEYYKSLAYSAASIMFVQDILINRLTNKIIFEIENSIRG